MNTYYTIIDKDGYEMPKHYSGRYRTYDEALRLLNHLNKDGEYKPYKMVSINTSKNTHKTH